MTTIASPVYDKKAVLDFFDIVQNHPWAEDKINEIMYLWDICDNREQQDLLKELICDFFVFDDKKLASAGKKISEQIANWKLSHETSLIIAVADEGQSDGSVVGVKSLELKIEPIHEWSKKCFHSIPSSISSINNGDSIILFDDFIGSGDKFIKKHKWLCDLIEKNHLDASTIKFHFVSFSGMQLGIDRLKNRGFKVFVCNHLIKGITDKNDLVTATKKLQLITELEDKLQDTFNSWVLSKYSFGYGKSESLYYWTNYSCPNNVFPIFWWPKLKQWQEFRPLFPRVK